jgi:hypothetical protein
MEQGWKPIELAQNLGVAPSFLSELIAELRTVLGFVNGVFPTHSDDEYRALLESVAEQGVVCAIVVDERGVIDGHARLRACKELAHIAELAAELPEWETTVEAARTDRGEAVELYGRERVRDCEYLASFDADVLARARVVEPPVDRRKGLSESERRALAITLNAHRRHLNRGDLRLLIEVEIMRDGGRSNAAIARLVGCTPQWVGQVREQLVEDEARFKSQLEVESKVLSVPWRPVVELDCPHCKGHLALERAGRDFRLELAAGAA